MQLGAAIFIQHLITHFRVCVCLCVGVLSSFMMHNVYLDICVVPLCVCVCVCVCV